MDEVGNSPDPGAKHSPLPPGTGSGAPQVYPNHDTVDDPYYNDSLKWIRIVVVFYATDLIVCTVVNFVHYFRGLYWLFITEAALAVLSVVFVLFLWKEMRPLFRWKSFSWPKAVVYSMAAILFAIAVNLGIKWLNKSIFNQDIHFYGAFRHLQSPKLVMITLVALLPAVFEEIAYRGIILHGLLKVAEPRQAVFISAFLFAIIHMSFISFFWLVPFAIWLGNVRHKERTIWYGVLIHFCFNITACVFEIFELQLL